MMTDHGGKVIKLFAFILFISAPFCAYANSTPIYATACQTLRGQERKSAAMLRATDIASKNAIESVDEVFALKNKLSQDDYNILVYELIDNNISELITKTTKSDDLEVCVEISGTLDTTTIKNTPNQLPEPIVSQKIILSEKPLLYIAPTHYYNDTSSKEVSKIIAHNFDNGENFYVTDKKNLANYIIYPKVLKAQVDIINDQTSRLHMVIAIDFEDTDTYKKTTEHKSKFILIRSQENEQTQAQDLMERLFKQASVSVLSKLETLAYKKSQDPNALPVLINAIN